MLTIDGIPILADEYEILTELRDQVLQHQGREILRKIKRTGNNIMICCPIHSDGQERKPSCGISTVDGKVSKAGTVHCFACGYVDTFEGMVAKCFGYDDPDFGKQWLLENFVTGENGDRPPLVINVSREKKIEKPQYISETELASYRQFYHDYMWQRKLTPEIVDRYDVGYQPDFRLITKNEDGTETVWPPVECLTFPCRDINGNTLFVSRRAIHNKNFFLPPDIEKPVYGIYELPKDAKEVVICESVFNALTCVAYGRPAVALFGTGTEFQYQQLKELGLRKYVIGLDPDKAGAKGSWKLKRALKDSFVTKLILPQGKDINDLSYEEFWRLPEIMF